VLAEKTQRTWAISSASTYETINKMAPAAGILAKRPAI
jgi:hypothetical protein